MPEWIKEHKNNVGEKEVLNDVKILNGKYNYTAFYTDKVCGGKYENDVFTPEIDDTAHLLELRVFNAEREFKAARTQIGKNFSWRTAEEAGIDKELYISETQLLDIDRKKSCSKSNNGITVFAATGGGRYSLPAEPDCDSIEIINYIKYDDYGNMQFADFRIKRFFKGGTENA